MPVPKKRSSKTRQRTRAAHRALSGVYTVVCQNCGEVHLRHHLCPACGFYRGKQLKKIESDDNASSAAV